MMRLIESVSWLFVLAMVDVSSAQTNPPLPSTTDVPTKGAGDSEAFIRSPPSKPGEFRASWIHSGYGIEGWGWDKTVGVLKSNGFSAILPNLLWAGLAHYPSKILPISPKVKQQGDQIAECLKACRKYGIEMHVWKVNYNLLNAPPEFVARLRGAGRIQKNRQGNDVNWLCPSHPENVALERDSMLEVVREYDVDGIHFDYIRYPDKDACFCSGCRERFEKADDIKIGKWPEDVLTGGHAEKFAAWRREQITQLVRIVSQEAHALKPGIKVSAAVWGGWVNARKSIGQDALAWIDAGYLDFVCPMDYEGEDSTFTDLVRKQVAATNHKIPLYIGMGAHKLSGPPQLARQIQLTRNLGADGFVVFNLTEKLATQFLPPLRLGNPTAPAAPRP
jgi:uncharacterized lipoprotein YddW (UPF0748 family)